MFIEDKFDSLMAFTDKAINGQSTLGNSDRASRRQGYDDWAGGSWEACTKLARNGWREGAEKIETMAKPLLDQIATHVRKSEVVFDIEGDSVDIGTFMTGDPESFLRWTDTEITADAKGKFVHIICSISASCGFTTEQLFAKGAAVTVLVDALEITGHRVTVDVVQQVSDRAGSDYRASIRIKNPEDSLNLESVAFACAHSSMLRRLIFSLEEQQTSQVIHQFGFSEYGGYGRPIDPQPRMECDIYIGASDAGAIQDPLRWARKQLVAQGVQFTD